MVYKESKKHRDILKSFLTIEENKKYLELYQKRKEEKYKTILAERFAKYYAKIIVVSYYSKSMYFFAQKYDMEIKKESKITNELILKHFQMEKDNDSSFIEISSVDILDYITNEKVYQAVSKLPEKQRQLLFLIYIKQIKEDIIADYYGVTRQAINKTKNNSLRKIKKQLLV